MQPAHAYLDKFHHQRIDLTCIKETDQASLDSSLKAASVINRNPIDLRNPSRIFDCSQKEIWDHETWYDPKPNGVRRRTSIHD